MQLTATQTKAMRQVQMLLTKHEAKEQLAWMEQLRTARDRQPTLVVVGEVKRGKSSLVNALTGTTVTPVDVGLATAGFVKVRPPSDELSSGSALLSLASGELRRITAAEVADWMTIDGPATEGLAWQDRPIGAEVAVESLHLPGMVLVDTPGVGGLVSAHAAAATMAAASATALLFVSDAGQVLTAPELRFLGHVAERVHWVFFAVTKTDRHPAWREVVAENRELLRRHAPRYAQAPMVAVSSSLAAMSTAQTDPVRRDKVLAASGITELAQTLMMLSTEQPVLRFGNALRTGRAGLDGVAASVLRARKAVAGGRTAVAELTAEKARLDDLRQAEGRWSLDLQRDLGRLRQKSVRQISTALEELRDRWRSAIAKEKRGSVDAVAQRMAAELESDLTAVSGSIAEAFYRDLDELIRTMFATLNTESPDLATHVTDDLRDLQLSARRRADAGTGQSIFDPSLIGSATMGMGLASHFGGGALAAATGVAAAPILLPAAFAGGLLMLNVRHRRTRAGRAQLLEMVNESVRVAQSELVGAVDSVMLELRPEVTVAFRAHLKSAITEIAAVIKQAETAAAQSAQERAAEVAALDTQLKELGAASRAVDEVLAELGRALGAAAAKPAPPPVGDDAGGTPLEST
jgi:predicted GTPase